MGPRAKFARRTAPDTAAASAGLPAEQRLLEAHRSEWEGLGEVWASSVAGEDCERMKFCKLAAETLKIRQEGERKAWGIGEGAAAGGVDASGLAIRVALITPAQAAAGDAKGGQ